MSDQDKPIPPEVAGKLGDIAKTLRAAMQQTDISIAPGVAPSQPTMSHTPSQHQSGRIRDFEPIKRATFTERSNLTAAYINFQVERFGVLEAKNDKQLRIADQRCNGMKQEVEIRAQLLQSKLGDYNLQGDELRLFMQEAVAEAQQDVVRLAAQRVGKERLAKLGLDENGVPVERPTKELGTPNKPSPTPNNRGNDIELS